MKVVYVDANDNAVGFPSASLESPDSSLSPVTDADQTAYRNKQGVLALLRAIRAIKSHLASGDFTTAVTAAAATFDDEQFANSAGVYAQDILTLIVPATPTFTSITPNSGSHLSTHAVTIVGTLFRAGATVTVGGLSCTSVVVVDAQTITCVVPIIAAGAKTVVIANPSGSSVTASSAYTST